MSAQLVIVKCCCAEDDTTPPPPTECAACAAGECGYGSYLASWSGTVLFESNDATAAFTVITIMSRQSQSCVWTPNNFGFNPTISLTYTVPGEPPVTYEPGQFPFQLGWFSGYRCSGFAPPEQEMFVSFSFAGISFSVECPPQPTGFACPLDAIPLLAGYEVVAQPGLQAVLQDLTVEVS